MRPHDLILFGATGFTGHLTALALARRLRGSTLRWALAGRSRDKLEAVRRDVAAIDPRLAELPLVAAHSDDEASLAALAASTKVVLSTVGPYARHGEPLVAACVQAGTDYADLTGEPAFVNQMIARYDKAARERGVRIVHCCGFDSIPHDLGVLYVVEQLGGGLPLTEPVSIEGAVEASASFSGGTWQSAVGAMAGLGRVPPAPRSPLAEGRRVRPQRLGVHRDPEGEGWLVPLPTIDPQVVLRSARALTQYGPDFQYGHYVRVHETGTLVAGGLALGGLLALAQLPPVRRWLQAIKASGEGPDAVQRARSWFRVTFRAKTPTRTLVARVSGGDPGYHETSKMLAETGICLAEDHDRLPPHTGIVTPAMGLGQPMLQRLIEHVLQFEVLARD
jgi:short subunit dehydrogenase-like uncharacterized protein